MSWEPAADDPALRPRKKDVAKVAKAVNSRYKIWLAEQVADEAEKDPEAASRLAEIYAENPYLPREHEEDVSHCGCPLGPGCWGTSGWHFSRHTLETLKLSGEAQAKKAGLPFEWNEGRERRYLGVPFAYAKCRRYEAAVHRPPAEDETERRRR